MAAGRERRKWAGRACLLILSGGVAASARGGETWGGKSLIDNKWSTADNWMPVGAPANDGTANIMMIGPGHPDSLVDVPWSVRSIQFSPVAVQFSITGSTLSIGDGGVANSSAVTQSIANNISLLADQTWNIESDLNVGGAISGSFGLTKTGAGALMLSGATANSYSGITTVNAGTLLLNKSVANGAVNGPLTIGDGVGSDVVRWMASEQIWNGSGGVINVNSSGWMDLNGFSENVRDLNLTGGKVTTSAGTLMVLGTIASEGASSSSIISDRLSLGSATRTIDVADGAVENDLVIEASIASGGLTKSGSGTLLMIGAANSYSGTTTVLDGLLVLAKNAADGAIKGDLVIGGGANFTGVLLGANEQIQAVGNTVSIFSNAVMQLNGFSETIGDLEMTGGAIAGGTLMVLGEVNSFAFQSPAQIGATVNLGGVGRSFTIADGAAAVDMEVSGPLINGGLIKNGPGTLLLSGAASTYTGVTAVNQGMLILNKSDVDGAISGNLTIGDGAGGINADVVHLAADEQIKATGLNWVNISSSGLLELAGHVETISNLSMTGGNITTGPASTGLLRVTGDLVSNTSSSSATIAGRMDLGGGMRSFKVADGTAAVDLSITAIINNGGITKSGDGKLRLLGNLYSGGTVLAQGGLILASDFSLGSGPLTIDGGTIEAEGSPTLNNSVTIEGPAAVVGEGNLRLNGTITSDSVLSKRGGGMLTILGPQNNSPGAGLNVLAGRVNLNSDAGWAVTASTAAIANFVLRIGKGENGPSAVVLGANQELAGLEVAAAANSGSQGLDLNSPSDPGAYRAVRIYAADLPATKSSIYAAIVNANAPGAADPNDGIFDSGLLAHPAARLGMGIVNDAQGDANLLIRPTTTGDVNLDGVVTISDFLDLATHFGQAADVTWQEGDLNYDGIVTISDFLDLAANFNGSYGPVVLRPADMNGTSVPEPNLLGLSACAGGWLAWRRRRRF